MIELDPVVTPMKYIVGSAAGCSCAVIGGPRRLANEISYEFIQENEVFST